LPATITSLPFRDPHTPADEALRLVQQEGGDQGVSQGTELPLAALQHVALDGTLHDSRG